MNIQNTQRTELAFKTKLTAITIGHGTNKRQAFVMCLHDAAGRAVLPMSAYTQLATSVGAIRRGDTVSIG